jgi:hypothetical protein
MKQLLVLLGSLFLLSAG